MRITKKSIKELQKYCHIGHTFINKKCHISVWHRPNIFNGDAGLTYFYYEVTKYNNGTFKFQCQDAESAWKKYKQLINEA